MNLEITVDAAALLSERGETLVVDPSLGDQELARRLP